MKLRSFLSIIFAIVLVSCKTGGEDHFIESSGLPGMIYDGYNKPCKNVQIQVYRLVDDFGELLLAVESDINGRFTLPALKQGNYRIELYKEDHETLVKEINYSSPLEVLYMKMYSQDQILDMAVQSLEERRIVRVENYLKRSESIQSDDPYHLYVQSIYMYSIEDYEQSLEYLKALVHQGYLFPYVHLLMADIYQYHLHETIKALESLNLFLSQIENDEVLLRKKELEKV